MRNLHGARAALWDVDVYSIGSELDHGRNGTIYVISGFLDRYFALGDSIGAKRDFLKW